MTKEFVPYELAVKLKELGFDEPCLGWMADWNKQVHLGKHEPSHHHKSSCEAILKSQAFRWFREKYRLHTYIEGAYPWFRYYINSEDNTLEGFKHLKYEEAELVCLTKLIEIVESKSE